MAESPEKADHSGPLPFGALSLPRPRTAVELARSRLPPGREPLRAPLCCVSRGCKPVFRYRNACEAIEEAARSPAGSRVVGCVEPAVRLRPVFEKWPRAEAVPPKFASSRDRWTLPFHEWSGVQIRQWQQMRTSATFVDGSCTVPSCPKAG